MIMGWNVLLDLSYVATGFSGPVLTTPEVEATGSGLQSVARIAASAALVLAIGTAAGQTGAISARNADLFVPASTASAMFIAKGQGASNEARARAVDPEAVESSDRLAAVRSALSLNVKQLAVAMRVGRPALYRWLEGGAPNETNLRRLKELYDIAASWSPMKVGPIGKDLITPIGEHGSLMSLLAAPTLDRAAVNSVLDSIKSSRLLAAKRQKKSEYRSPSAIMRERGYKSDSLEEQRRRVADATDF